MPSENGDDALDFFNLEIPLPKEGAKIFQSSRDDDWSYGASVHIPGTNRWDAYALGFKQLADSGVEAVGERRNRRVTIYPDAIVFAVMFNYRQYLEVRMKGLILAAEQLLDVGATAPPFGHDLAALWRRLRPLLEKIWPGADYLDTIETQTAEFASVDPGGEAFRYPVDRAGKPNLTGVRGINLMHVKEIIDGIDSILDGSDTGIYEMLQSKYEMQAEWRSEAAAYEEHYDEGDYYNGDDNYHGES